MEEKKNAYYVMTTRSYTHGHEENFVMATQDDCHHSHTDCSLSTLIMTRLKELSIIKRN